MSCMVTRKSKRIAALSTTTSVSTGSPIFTSGSIPETPLTSMDSNDESDVAGAVQTRSGRTKVVATRSANEIEVMTRIGRTKRPASFDAEDASEGAFRPLKKRAVSARMYVSVPPGKRGQAVKREGKGKEKARPTRIPSEREASEDTDDSRSCPVIDDSEGSGSEFQLEDSAQDEEDEEVMLDAAVRLSLRTHSRINEAGPSSGGVSEPSPAVSPAVRRRAVAAERRLAARRRNKFGEPPAEELEDLSDLSSGEYPLMNHVKMVATQESEDQSDFSSKEYPLRSQVKMAATKKVAPIRGSDMSNMSYVDYMAAQKSNRKAVVSARRANKGEERALMQRLGRRLTHAERTSIALQRNHPELRSVWVDLKNKITTGPLTKDVQPTNLKLTLLPFQLESLFWMRKQETGVWRGGILADEMGMGKTIQIISLFVSDIRKPNLVIAPTVALMQWRNEIQAHTDGLNVLVWHGFSRESDVEQLKTYDVVLTTYAILESCFRKQEKGFKRKGLIIKEKSPIHQIEWKRVVLDEAHNIKERSTNTAKAAFELKTEHRWCLSGTPLQNRVGELYSLVRFLGCDPFSYYFCKLCDCKSLHWLFEDNRSCKECGHSPMQHTCFWNTEILTPIQKHGMSGPGKDAFGKLKLLLGCVMLRRTKLERADDLGLPPRTVIVRRNYFNPEEKEIYSSLFSDAKRQFNTYVDQGTVLNNYSNIFTLLTRMRQMACHPDLVLRSKSNSNTFIPDNEGEATVCRLCNDIAEDAIQAKCRHIFDRECIKRYVQAALEYQPACPVCHLPLTIDLEAPALEIEENVVALRQGILGRLDLDNWRSSSKIEALVEELDNLRLQDSTTKSIVFSQFVNFLDLIAFRLQKAGFNLCRLDGSLTPQARDATIKHFMDTVEVTVFLVSLKAGGLALNLTEASRVYLMDSWWNPAVEYQAMDRIHRLGQRRPVQATKLVIEDSIESRIVQLQEKKSAMVDATLSADESAMGRLTPEDLGFLFRL